jgi:putative membrane protein
MNTAHLTTLGIALALGTASVVTAQSTPPGTMLASQAAPRARGPRMPSAVTPTAPAAVSMTVTASDVVERLHVSNLREIEAGKLASAQAGALDVRQYGEHLMKDHTLADKELGELAQRNGISLPAADASNLENLRGLRGAEFDRAFLNMMVRDHQNAIHMVRTAQARAENRDIRALLDKILPTLQQHEEHAQQLNSGHS